MNAMRGHKARLYLPYPRWPSEDRLLWEQAMGSDDPFEAVGARLAKATQNNYLFGWRRFLGFLSITEPAALAVAPAERLTLERIRSFTVHLAETNIPRSVAVQVDTLYKAARTMMPVRDWSWLKAFNARLYAAAPALAPIRPVITSLQLLELGQKLMDGCKQASDTSITLRNAIRYRDGFMFALLAFIPIRRKNFAALEIGRHLIREGDDWFIIIPRSETKTRVPIEFSIPDLLKSYLALYLEIIRPRMLRHTSCAALWLNPYGGALSYTAIWLVFNRHSKTRLGFHITPHDARDAAATTWALSAPNQIGVARDLLSHSDLRTTTKHYNRARGIEASRAYNQVLSGIRRNQSRRS